MRLAMRKKGWIGVDLGTSTVKIAQLAQGPRGFHLAATAIIPRSESWSAELAVSRAALSSINEISAARSLEDRYSGRRVAGLLSMALCDMHLLDRSLEPSAKTHQIIRQAIETATQQSAEQVQFDYWSAPASDKNSGWTQALAVSRNWTDQLVEDVAQTGWSCQAIDGLPQAMTRAMKLAYPEASRTPLVALDWGYSRATLCVIDKGQPTYVRCLKDCGFGPLVDAVINDLKVTEVEAQQLLEEHGMAKPEDGDQSEIACLIQEIIAPRMSQLTQEIKRSLSHYQYLRRADAPRSLCLMGGGSTMCQVEQWLSKQLNLETQVWKLPRQTNRGDISSNSRADCLFAPAIALSALAWEKS